ncbi:MAG: site-specific DNA-methyltransferase [Thermoanaerobacterium sp.]|nr:site-specific DNA-methyltransferase [Thermoanaerobacterium sp.]
MPTINFKGKTFVQNHHLTVKYHQLIPVKEKSLTDKVSLNDNLIIHGDNLLALKALLPNFAGKIKCIYIDPPYNTGNEKWVYNDNVNSPMIKEWLGKVVDKDDLSRHDKWLCMMMPRLKLLKELLSPDGVIFVSIDHNEIHHLKCLMNEIFGEENYKDTIVIRRGVKNVQAQFETIDSLSNGYESILMYTKDPNLRFNKIYEDLEEEKEGSWNNHWRGTDRPSMRYELFGITPTEGQWRWSKERSMQAIENYNVLVKDLRKNNLAITQENIDRWYLNYVEENGEEIDLLRLSDNGTPEHYIPPTNRKLLSNLWIDLKPNGSSQLKKIFGKKVFENPKSIDLIKRLIKFVTDDPNAIILDSFAGSGTTGHAVLEINKEENKNLRFILIECEDYADSITAERIRRAINGIPNSKDRRLREGLSGTFSYFELGPAIEMEDILRGDKLPEYEELARYVFYTATGDEFDPVKIDRERNFIGETSEYEVYLFYKPDLNYLKNTALDLDTAKSLGDYKGKKRLVFAPMKYLDPEFLQEYHIEYCQLPFEIYRFKE